MDNKKRTKVLMIVAVLTLLILVTGATYAYFTAQGGQGSNVNMNVTTHTTDSLVFEVGAPISIYADQSNFADGMANQFGKTTATATAKAGSNTEKFTGKYNIFFVIDENDFEYTTGNSTAELIMTVKDPNGTEVTSIPNLTHTTVKGVSGFDITTKKGTFAVAKEYVIEAATGATKIDNWEITVTLVNLDSNQNQNTKKTFRGQLFVTKENMESYALPIVNTIETTVGESGTELEVKAKVGASTAEVVNYYYGIEEASSATPKVKRLATTKAVTYEKSTSDTHTFTGLTSGKNYKVSIYTEDANGFKSPTYENVVTTDNYVLPKITSVEASVGATNIDLTVNTTQGNNAIAKYYYKVDGIDTEYQESTSNKKSYTGLTTGETYTINIYTQDTNERNSYVYTMKVTPIAPPTIVDYIIGLKGTNNLYQHDGTITATTANTDTGVAVGDVIDANDGNYRYSGSYETTQNWVCFGQDDATGNYASGWCDDEHLYRIIGVFDSVIIGEDGNPTGENEQRVKLIKAYEGTQTSLGTIQQGFGDKDGTYYKGNLARVPGYYWSGQSSNNSNIWTLSTLNTDVLNGTYLEKLDEDGNNWTTKISTTEWKIGRNNISKNVITQNAAKIYLNEIVNPKSKTLTKTKIGLMYVSDYAFASNSTNWTAKFEEYSYDTNKRNNWLFLGISEWTIMPSEDSASSSFVLYENGYGNLRNVGNAEGVRPTFYLNGNVTYAGGTGTSTDPYRIA